MRMPLIEFIEEQGFAILGSDNSDFMAVANLILERLESN